VDVADVGVAAAILVLTAAHFASLSSALLAALFAASLVIFAEAEAFAS
jgi:hypothetical protein